MRRGRRGRRPTASGREAWEVYRFIVESPLYMAPELVAAELALESVAPIAGDGTQSPLQLATGCVNQ